MEKVFINTRTFDVEPLEGNIYDVEEIRKVANIPDNRVMVIERSNGKNEIAQGMITVNPGDHLSALPIHERG